nr:MAG: Protein of unknown function (DUF722) [Bacteriophage sp.]
MEPENNARQLTPELEAIIRLASETAVESYRKELERQQEQDGKARRERHHRVVNSAKMLLKNYRRFKKMTVSSVYGKDTSTNETLVELLELMQGIYRSGELEVVSIKDRVARTELMIEHIDAMLEVYKKDCNRSPEGQRRYRVIYWMYLSEDESKTAEDIAEMENVVVRTVFRDIKTAYEELAVLFFGIDGVRFSEQ